MKLKNKIKNKDSVFILILLFFYLILFIYIKDKMLFNPDFGNSDVFYGMHASIKYYSAQLLKKGQLPFWTDNLQGGFPLFSDWQTGLLCFVNLILYKFLAFSDAYNLSLILVFLFLSIGFYLLLRRFAISPVLAFLISLNFSFNGAISLRLTHFPVLQTFSLVPLLFYSAVSIIKTKRKIFYLLFPLLLSQMIFTGFIQIIFMALLGLISFIFLLTRFYYKLEVKKTIFIILLFSILIGVGVLISLPQVMPSMLLSSTASRNFQLDYQDVTAIPLRIMNILNFISPFAFGNPKYGTYAPYSDYWGIFWENTPYLGIICGILFIFSSIYSLIKEKKFIKFFLLSLLNIIILLLLALGKSSPFYFIFNFPPFNFFRTQSRFLLMVNFYIFLMLGMSLHLIFKTNHKLIKFTVVILLLLNFADLLMLNKNYHLFINKQQYFSEPELAKGIDNNAKYIAYDLYEEWNKVFFSKGWSTSKEVNAYLFFKNFMYANSNLFYGKKIYDINNGRGFRLKRPDYIKALIDQSIEVTDHKANVIHNIKNMTKLVDVSFLIATWETPSKDLIKVDQKNFAGLNLYLYKINNGSSPQDHYFYIPSKITKISYVNDFVDLFEKGNDFTDNAVLENSSLNPKNSFTPLKIVDKHEEDTYIKIKGLTEKSALLVFRKNYYPEWSIYLDGKKQNILKINLIHMGVLIPKGEHVIELKYENNAFKKGMILSILTLCIYLFIIKKVKVY